MKTRKVLCAFAAMVLILCISGCSVFSADYPVSVGGTVINNAPQKVVCLSAGIASAASALGYNDYIVGAPTEFIGEDSKNISDVGNSVVPNEKAILDASPDVVITVKEPDDSLKLALKSNNIKLAVIEIPTEYKKLREYYSNIAKIFSGKTDGKKNAKVYTKEMNRSVAGMKEKNTQMQKQVAVFVESNFVITGDSLAGEALREAGIKNVFDSNSNYKFDAGELASKNPDIIFCGIGKEKEITENPAFKDISAVKNSAVYGIDLTALMFAGEGFVSVMQEITNYIAA